MEREEWFNEVYNRQIRNRVLPSIKDFYRKSETAMGLFPKLKYSITVAFNTVFSYLKASHDIMSMPNPTVSSLPSPTNNEAILDELLAQTKQTKKA